MLKLIVDGDEYDLEFRHARREGKRPALKRRGPIRAVTTCVVTWEGIVDGETVDHRLRQHFAQQHRFIAIGNAVCDNSDQFSRRSGRFRALEDALECGALAKVKTSLWNAHAAQEAAVRGARDPGRVMLSMEEIYRLKRDGAAKRAQRAKKLDGGTSAGAQ